MKSNGLEKEIENTWKTKIGKKHTGGWGNYTDVSCKIRKVTGVQKIYLVYKGTDNIANLNYFKFYSDVKDASLIQAESFDNLSVGGTEAYGNSQVIAGIANGAYALYKNVNFSSGSSIANFYSSCGTGDGTIEIRLDSSTGELIGTAPIQNTGGWNVYKSVSCNVSKAFGIKDVYLVFKGADYVLNLNYFRFPLNKKNPYLTTQAENYSYLSGGIVENCVDGTKNIGGILNNYYASYNDLNFNSTGAKSAELRYSCATNGGTVEIRLGSPTGILVGTANISNTGGWGKYRTTTCSVKNVTGVQDVYLVFKGTSHVLNLNHFKFNK